MPTIMPYSVFTFHALIKDFHAFVGTLSRRSSPTDFSSYFPLAHTSLVGDAGHNLEANGIERRWGRRREKGKGSKSAARRRLRGWVDSHTISTELFGGVFFFSDIAMYICARGYPRPGNCELKEEAKY